MSKNKTILSIYSDGECGAVTFLKGSKLFSEEIYWEDGKSQSIDLLLLIEKIIKTANFDTKKEKIDVIIAPKGPSSFTTTRTLLTIAKSFQFCFPNAEIFAPSHFHVLAFAAKDEIRCEKSNRLFSKPISSSKVEVAYEAQNQGVLDEDSSIDATNKFAEEIELREKSIESEKYFYVLIDALNNGFYCAFFKLDKNKIVPMMIEEPAFYDKYSSNIFLEKCKHKVLITNFKNTSNIFDDFKIVKISKNLSEQQINLYKNGVENNLECSEFRPFYLHIPDFKKVRSCFHGLF
ncbi:MAG: hypothetical protein LBS83_01225 [Holosporales bacterium]|nr:hypothetical protein [Holosporales bacterium]